MSTQQYVILLTSDLHGRALNHLVRGRDQEDLCFATWYPSRGHNRHTALIHDLILPLHGERNLHGNASFTAEYFQRSLEVARKARSGLAFMHSHLGPGWQGMSADDIDAEQGHAAAVKAVTKLPFVGLTAGTDGSWSARHWEKSGPKAYRKKWCSHVSVVGKKLSVTLNPNQILEERSGSALTRTRSAWGPGIQAILGNITFGVVGTGSVGSLVAESLARMGVSRIKLIDFDTLEEINLDRTLHGTRGNAAKRLAKVNVIADGISRGATSSNFTVEPIEYSICEDAGFRKALDCDVLFSCVDRPWPRSVLNYIAYAHLIPVIDGGIRVRVKQSGLLRAADWKAHIASPHRRCLECLDQYNAGMVAVEKEGLLDNPKYIEGLPEDDDMKRNENVFVFSMSVASFEILQMLMMIIAPLHVADAGEQAYHFVPGIMDFERGLRCRPNCSYPKLTALGDSSGFAVTGSQRVAEDARTSRAKKEGFFRKVFGQFGLSK